MSMNQRLKYKSAKLYTKQQISQWNLPKEVLEDIKFEQYENFFAICIPKKSNDEIPHERISLFPLKHDFIYFLEIKFLKINPEKIYVILSMLRKLKCDIISSTGICLEENECYFGVYFASGNEISNQLLKKKIKDLIKVKEIIFYKYDFDGCCEI
ncbi:MAG: hypothetical protein ACTSRZ_13060 [Promethearchaeota archaeon]